MPPRQWLQLKVAAISRPSITSAGTAKEWKFFENQWRCYADATGIVGRPRVLQLLECCDLPLRRTLTQNARTQLNQETEATVLAAIKHLAVRSESDLIAKVTFRAMRQAHDEPVRNFCARLRAQADLCDFEETERCECGRDMTVHFSERHVADQICVGLSDVDIRQALMTDPIKKKTVDQTLIFVEAREEARRCAPQLTTTPDDLDAVHSSYRRSKRPAQGERPLPPQSPQQTADTCSYCGGTGHGRNAPTRIRRHKCPAFNRDCTNCGKAHHMAKVCRSEPSSSEVQNESAIYHEVCVLTSLDGRPPRELSHHRFNRHLNSRTPHTSKPPPLTKVQVKVHPDDYSTLGFHLSSGEHQTSVTAMADTGCQSCLMGTSFMQQLNLTKKDLLPVKLRMRAANGGQFKILGAILMRLTNPRTNSSTGEMVYVSPDVSKFYINRETLEELEMYVCTFPALNASMTMDPQDVVTASTTESSNTPQPCKCPRHTLPPKQPTPPPFPICEENRARLEEHLLQVYASSAFNTCEHQPLPIMSGKPLRLMIAPDATPTAHHKPIPVPLHWQEEVKAGLDRDVRLGVLEKVPVGTAVTWCHHMIICPKKNGSLRRTIDFQALNWHATRETHHTQSPFHQARSVPQHTKKTVFDAWNGYHSVALDPADRHFTTFITPWGRYRYCTAPQGYIASGDGYTSRYDEIVAHVPHKTKCIDDTLLWSQSVEEAYSQAVEWLNICGNHGITLNPAKFKFARDSVEFTSFVITPTTVKPCEKYIKAITEFPTPKNLTDVRSWFGLVNQVAYAFCMTEAMAPFRTLLKPTEAFQWTATHDTAFQLSKQAIAREIEHGVEIFDKSKPTCLATDWSKDGVGYWLFQKHCDCPSGDLFCCRTGWKITLMGSRFTHPAESRYAPIEGEALAVAVALDKARHFVLGCSDLTIATDHKPLLKIFGDRSLDQIGNTRLRNLKEKTLPYRFRMIHIPGVKNQTPDALSRYPTGTPTPERLVLQDDVHAVLDQAPTRWPQPPTSLLSGISLIDSLDDSEDMETILQDSLVLALTSTHPISWEQVQTATAEDADMLLLMHTIETGFPDQRSSLPASIQMYHPHRHHLSTTDGVAVYKDRIILPKALRSTCLASLHAAHQGTSHMIAKAESSVFWPGITADITATRADCTLCHRMAPSQAAMPPVPPTPAQYPFQCISADLLTTSGMHYLVIVDRYSNWPMVRRVENGAKGVVDALCLHFATYSIPEELATDGGPEFTAAITVQFLKDWGIHHRLSSVAFPHSNCRAEIGVKSIKRLLAGNISASGNLNTDAFQRAVLQHRNTPDPATKLSPAMCVFGRPVRDLIPVKPGKYAPHKMWKQNLELREQALSHRYALADRQWSEHTKSLPPLQPGTHVYLQNQTGNRPKHWNKTGVVVESLPYHQYRVRMDGSGRATLRNRKFLRIYSPTTPTPPRHTAQDDLQAASPSTTHMFYATIPPTIQDLPAPLADPAPLLVPPVATPLPVPPALPELLDTARASTSSPPVLAPPSLPPTEPTRQQPLRNARKTTPYYPNRMAPRRKKQSATPRE